MNHYPKTPFSTLYYTINELERAYIGPFRYNINLGGYLSSRLPLSIARAELMCVFAFNTSASVTELCLVGTNNSLISTSKALAISTNSFIVGRLVSEQILLIVVFDTPTALAKSSRLLPLVVITSFILRIATLCCFI